MRACPNSLSLAGLGAGLGALLVATPAFALVNGTVEISINGAAPVVHGTTATAAATDAGGDGTLRFVGNAIDPEGLWSLQWDYAADLDPTANAKVTGTATLTNHGGVPVSVDVRVRLPLCPAIAVGSVLGGTCSAKLFYGPFHMGTTGSGTAQTQQLFGAPFPSMNAPAIADDIGMRHRLTVTAGDAVEVRTVLFVCGAPENFVACEPEEGTPAGSPTSGGPEADPTPSGPGTGGNAPAGSTASGGPVADPTPSGGTNKKSTVTPTGPGAGPIGDPTSTGGNGSGNGSGAGKNPGGTGSGSGPVADPAPTGKQPTVTPSTGGSAADPIPPSSGDSPAGAPSASGPEADAPAPAKPSGEADAGSPASGAPVADGPKRTPVRIVIPRKDEQPARRRPVSGSRQTNSNTKGSGSPTSAW